MDVLASQKITLGPSEAPEPPRWQYALTSLDPQILIFVGHTTTNVVTQYSVILIDFSLVIHQIIYEIIIESR